MSSDKTKSETKRKKTRKEIFFEKMEKIVPLKEWCALIEPYYHNTDSRAAELEVMLKMYLVSRWFNLSDSEAEDMANEYVSVRNYIGIEGPAPDETALGKFRAVLENNGLAEKISKSLNARLKKEHMILRPGASVDAIILDSPTV